MQTFKECEAVEVKDFRREAGNWIRATYKSKNESEVLFLHVVYLDDGFPYLFRDDEVRPLAKPEEKRPEPPKHEFKVGDIVKSSINSSGNRYEVVLVRDCGSLDISLIGCSGYVYTFCDAGNFKVVTPAEPKTDATKHPTGPGQVVRLLSGGPWMTTGSKLAQDESCIYTCWFHEGKPNNAYFKIETLILKEEQS